MTSTRGILWTGLKKCMPTTRSGCAAFEAISVIGSVDVFDAKIAVGEATVSQSARTACLTDIFSSTASIVMSQPSKPAYSSEPPRSDIFAANSAPADLPGLDPGAGPAESLDARLLLDLLHPEEETDEAPHDGRADERSDPLDLELERLGERQRE